MDNDIKFPPGLEYKDPRDYKNDQVEKFLKKISMLESSGGKNTKHRVITDPESIHYGTSAVGEYGLMPVTAKDLDRKYHINELEDLDKFEVQERLKQDPELTKRIAETLASQLLLKAPQEKAAYLWEQGINKKPDENELNESKRVRRFRSLKNVK